MNLSTFHVWRIRNAKSLETRCSRREQISPPLPLGGKLDQRTLSDVRLDNIYDAIIMAKAITGVHPVHLVSAHSAPRWPPTLRPSQPTSCESVGRLLPSASPSPFIITTQPESRHSCYSPTEGERLSRPRHGKDVQPVPVIDRHEIRRSDALLTLRAVYDLGRVVRLQRKIDNDITAPLLQRTAMLPTGRCHIKSSQSKICPCDATICQHFDHLLVLLTMLPKEAIFSILYIHLYSP